MLPTLPSLGDIATTATFFVLGAGQVVTWGLIVRDDRRSAVKRATEDAKESATNSAALKDLASANERIATALEKLDQWAREHELVDERRWAKHEQFQEAQAETNQRLTNI